MKVLGNVNAKIMITGLYQAAFLRIIKEFEKIFKFFKNVTQHLDNIINYGLSFGIWKLAKS